MNNGNVDLTISIVNTNNRDLLQSCLTSIYDNTNKTDFEIIVVDNCSTDGSVEMIKENFEAVKLVINDNRQGFGFSQNRAFEKSKGHCFLVFNEDMFVLPNAIDIMFDRIKQDNTIGALGCKLLNSDGTLQHSCSNFPNVYNEILKNLFPCNLMFSKSKFRSKLRNWDHNKEREVDVILGACMMIPRKVITEVGLFDEQFILFKDEYDLCKRIKQAGYKVLFTPKAEIIHYCSVTLKTMSAYSFYLFLESERKYYQKYHGKVQAYIVRFIRFLGFTFRILGWMFIGVVQKSKRETAIYKIGLYLNVYPWFFGLK